MDITVTGRRLTVSDAVRDEIAERLTAVERLRDRVIRTEVEFTANDVKGSPDQAIQAEITLRSKGPVVRAEATASDKMAAFDKAFEKLKVQLRKASDRRKRHPHLRTEILDLPPIAEEPLVQDAPAKTVVAGLEVTGDGPLVVREKEFPGTPLTLAQALDEMELVGHDFFLYVDKETSRPSVVYRRKGYDYGVIYLKVE